MIKKIGAFFSLIFVITCIVSLCACGRRNINNSNNNSNNNNNNSSNINGSGSSTVDLPELVNAPLLNQQREALTLPEIDLKDMYIVVKSGDTDSTNHTLTEINSYSVFDYANMGVDKYEVVGWLLENKDSEPQGNPNLTLSIRGQSSTKVSQKSYKIKLDGIKWMGQKTINLNKHYFDKSRILNKLAYDLMDEIPQVISLQTQFVHLYIKDLSGDADPSAAEFVDYGLFTHVEQLNNAAMKRLGLDKEGSLYKIANFEFYQYDEVKLTTDPDYSEIDFEKRLENKGATDNEKLMEFVKIINSPDITDEDLLDYYLDIDNVAYWMAFQILINNVDTNCRNFYIYSPSNLEKWYFISWDNDGAFASLYNEVNHVQLAPWRTGVSDYWGTLLFKRLLRTEKFRKAVLAAAYDLKTNYLTEEHIGDLIELYYSQIEEVMFTSVDKKHLTTQRKEILSERYPKEIEVSYERLVDSLKSPMPFFLGNVNVMLGGVVHINWDSSYDFNNEKITYVVEVTDDPSFEKVLLRNETDKLEISFSHVWGAGAFFIRVTAVNESGYKMVSFDTSSAEGYGNVYGARKYVLGGN